MVALVTSSLIGIIGLVAVVLFGKRRDFEARLTWGEANLAATYTFALMFWWYGVIPHQWLSWAENELDWTSSSTVWGPLNLLRPEAEGGWLPLTVNYLHVKDLIAVLIYVVALGLQIWVWAWWNDRKKKADAEAAVVPTSTYGRPLVKKG
ncbi:MAG: hypothetical protein U5K30_05230 [Acidimicrobiales bacterium]|nr:hypothetical protein [Acidimicrobiales bacterium]